MYHYLSIFKNIKKWKTSFVSSSIFLLSLRFFAYALKIHSNHCSWYWSVQIKFKYSQVCYVYFSYSFHILSVWVILDSYKKITCKYFLISVLYFWYFLFYYFIYRSCRLLSGRFHQFVLHITFIFSLRQWRSHSLLPPMHY